MRAKKSLGQNFLTSKAVARRIVAAGSVLEGDTVLEIGPGKGMLTKELLGAGASVIAVEKDAELIPILKETFQEELELKKLSLIHGDIREIDFPIPQAQEYKIIANIPYYITGELFRYFLSCAHQPTTLVFLVQKEVAERIAKDKKESLLSMSVKVFGDPKYKGTVKAAHFKPAPGVDSAILAVTNISRASLSGLSESAFFDVLKAGFSHKRKVLRKNLDAFHNISSAFSTCNIQENARAETLAKDDWLCLAKSLERGS